MVNVVNDDLLCCRAWFFFWYACSSISYGSERPGTARFAPIEWLLQVRDRAHCAPLGSVTPHCFSTSTGPLGLGTLGLGSSFFFFFLGSPLSPLSSSPSALRFLPFLGPSPSAMPLTALFLALFCPFIASSPSALSPPLTAAEASSTALPSSPTPSLLPSEAFSLARFAASRASFFLRAFSCFALRQPRMCSAAACFSTGRLQCLQMTVSSWSSRGFPVGKAAMVFSSISGRMGEESGELGTASLLSACWDEKKSKELRSANCSDKRDAGEIAYQTGPASSPWRSSRPSSSA